MNNNLLKVENKTGRDSSKSKASKYSAVPFTNEIEFQTKPVNDQEEESEENYSDNYEDDFDEDFEPYETSHDGNKKDEMEIKSNKSIKDDFIPMQQNQINIIPAAPMPSNL